MPRLTISGKAFEKPKFEGKEAGRPLPAKEPPNISPNKLEEGKWGQISRIKTE